MTDQQLTFEENEIAQLVNGAYDKLRAGAFAEALQMLERALEMDVEYSGVTATLKGVRFWRERQARVEEIVGDHERAAYLLAQWTTFCGFADRIDDLPDRCFQDIKYFVHATALAYLLQHRPDREPGVSPRDDGPALADHLHRIGHCYKAMGDFGNAIEQLERASSLWPDSPAILAELADCYSLINEPRAAKVFFREAFFLGPDQVQLDRLESPLIRRLIDKIRGAGITRDTAEWIPVYGTLLGAFSVKRELKPVEYGRLRQSIYELEQTVPAPDSGRQARGDRSAADSALVPRLINRYFWLIDHYQATNEERHKVEEVLERLRALDPGVYRDYVV